MATVEMAVECIDVVTGTAVASSDSHSTSSTATVARRDATEQRSGRVVLCDAASRVHRSAPAHADEC